MTRTNHSDYHHGYWQESRSLIHRQSVTYFFVCVPPCNPPPRCFPLRSFFSSSVLDVSVRFLSAATTVKCDQFLRFLCNTRYLPRCFLCVWFVVRSSDQKRTCRSGTIILSTHRRTGEKRFASFWLRLKSNWTSLLIRRKSNLQRSIMRGERRVLTNRRVWSGALSLLFLSIFAEA